MILEQLCGGRVNALVDDDAILLEAHAKGLALVYRSHGEELCGQAKRSALVAAVGDVASHVELDGDAKEGVIEVLEEFEGRAPAPSLEVEISRHVVLVFAAAPRRDAFTVHRQSHTRLSYSQPSA